MNHVSVDDVAEVAFEDSHGFGLGVTVRAGVVVELAGARFATELGDGHTMEAGVDSSVATAVEPVAHRFTVAFG